MQATDITKVTEILSGAKSILIVSHSQPTLDSMGATLALYLGLVSMDKTVTVACATPMTVGLSSFVGADKVQSTVKQNSFVVSLDYQEGSIEKVSYNIAGNKFNLVIEERPGFGSFSEQNVSFSRSGGHADVVFFIGGSSETDFGDIFGSLAESISQKPMVVLSKDPGDASFGTIRISDSQSSCLTELTAVFLSSLGVTLTPDIATNILNGIYGATDSFRSKDVTSRAFEVASVCLKAGGKRFVEFEQETVGLQSSIPFPTVAQQPVLSPQQSTPSSQAVVEKPPQEDQQSVVTPTGKKQTPEEWLKPKIFKSSQPSPSRS